MLCIFDNVYIDLCMYVSFLALKNLTHFICQRLHVCQRALFSIRLTIADRQAFNRVRLILKYSLPSVFS